MLFGQKYENMFDETGRTGYLWFELNNFFIINNENYKIYNVYL